MKKQGLLINEFDGDRIYVDREFSYPEYLKEYLNQYGIMLVGGKYIYTGGLHDESKVNIITYHGGNHEGNIVFYISNGSYIPDDPKYLAQITPDNEVYFQNEQRETSSIQILEDGSVLRYAHQGVVCDLKIKTDAIGNVFVSIGAYDIEFGKVSILVGDEHKDPESYIDDLIKYFDGCTNGRYTEKDKNLIHAMINDPRVLKTIKSLMSVMANSIDEAKTIRIKKIYDEYLMRIKMGIAELNKEYIPLIEEIITCSEESKVFSGTKTDETKSTK